jgi:hypothetical protein
MRTPTITKKRSSFELVLLVKTKTTAEQYLQRQTKQNSCEYDALSTSKMDILARKVIINNNKN